MKKFLVVLVVLSLVGLASIALAADVTVGGSVQIRSRNFQNMSFDKSSNSGTEVDTQERIMIDVNAKAGDNVKGKISLWNDWQNFGNGNGAEKAMGQGFGSSGTTGNQFGFREAWVSFNLPDIPVNVTVGHQLLQLGNGWFIKNKHYGSDAWVISNTTGNNTLGFVNMKLAEGTTSQASTDVDTYTIFDVLKLSDAMSVGIDLTNVVSRNSATTVNTVIVPRTDLQNIGLHFNGKMGALKLAAEFDAQMGEVTGTGGNPDEKFKGMQLVVQGNMAMDPLTINFLLGYGTGQDLNSSSDDLEEYYNLLDTDPRYTFLYEYKLNTAANGGPNVATLGIPGVSARKNTGMANTTVLGAGVMFAASKSLSIGLDAYYLQATEKVPTATFATTGELSDDLGVEIDAKILWKLYDNLTWNWDIGYFMPGKVYKTAGGKDDAAMGIQGVLAFKF